MRIISLVPSISELIVDLGLENMLVGITKFCVHPKELIKRKTIVGGTKTIKLEKIKDLKPTIILCNKEENTKEIVENCRQICEVNVSDIYTVADTLQLINNYGKMFSCEEKAKEIIYLILNKNIQFREHNKFTKKLNVAYFIWRNPWMIAANNTFIHHLLEMNNFRNVFENKKRYPEVQLKELKNIENLDYIFLSSEPYPFKEKDINELSAILPNTKIVCVDGEMFSWYGSRLVKAFSYFENLQKQLRK